MKITKNDIKKAFTASIPVLTGYVTIGIGFGVILSAKGYNWIWALVMSVCIYAGSMQYVAVGLLSGGASLLTTALTTFMVNARHLFYGISMIDKYKGAGKLKPYLIFALTDETYSLVCDDRSYEGCDNRFAFYFLVSALNQVYWCTGSVIGAVLGSVIPFSTEGIDFALTALFITVFTEQWMSTKNHLSAITGVVCTVVSLLIFGAENMLIPAMLFIALALTLMRNAEGITNE